VLCGECGELMNSLIIKDGNVVMENDHYFKHFIEKKRRQPERLWNIKDVEKVEMSILYGKLPISKRQRWLDKSEGMIFYIFRKYIYSWIFNLSWLLFF
jgi:hypothetical protein